MEKDEKKEFLMRFGQNVRALRKARGHSLRGLAALCNIDHSDIGKIEKGEINITLLTILELSKALEVQPIFLMDFD